MFVEPGEERVLKPIDITYMTGKSKTLIEQDLKIESEILDNLVAAWNAFVKLPVTHPMVTWNYDSGGF